MTVTPFVGWVTAEQVGLDTKLALPIWQKDNWEIAGEYLLYLTHYGDNQSGFQPTPREPFAGGYFSPQVFINQIPRLAATYSWDNKDELYLAAGPALQYIDIDEVTQVSVFRVGGDAHGAYTKRFSKSWLFKVVADYTQIASVYMRIQVNGLLVYTFY